MYVTSDHHDDDSPPSHTFTNRSTSFLFFCDSPYLTLPYLTYYYYYYYYYIYPFPPPPPHTISYPILYIAHSFVPSSLPLLG